VLDEIAWVDKTKKNGRLKFVELSSDLLTEIRSRLQLSPITPVLKPNDGTFPGVTRRIVGAASTHEALAPASLSRPIETPEALSAAGWHLPVTIATYRNTQPNTEIASRSSICSLFPPALCLFFPYRVEVSSRGRLLAEAEGSATAQYFELRGLGDIAAAQWAADILNADGLRVYVLRKQFFWVTSNSVLVRPIASEYEGEAFRSRIETRGFTVQSTTWLRTTQPLLSDSSSN
jgi:hypothetical protein